MDEGTLSFGKNKYNTVKYSNSVFKSGTWYLSVHTYDPSKALSAL